MPPPPNKEKILNGAIIKTDPNNPNPSSSNVTMGGIRGQFEINADGSASYTISLEVPPGRAGMQPELDLAYNSNNGNGILGVGWTLKGLSRIYRCNKTLVLDKEAEAIKFDNDDRLCLDGEYLIEVKGNGPVYDIENEVRTEFRPEHDPFTRVFATSIDGLGYTSFIVLKKNGLILRYGKSNETRIEKNRQIWTASTTDRSPASLDDSQKVRYAWLLEEIEDRVGNGMYYEYNEYDKGKILAGGEKLLSTIRYTYRKTDPPDPSSNNHPHTNRSVRFFYEDNFFYDSSNPTRNPNPSTAFVSGIAFVNTNLLKRIEMWAPNPYSESSVKSYNLQYNNEDLAYINPVSYDSKFTNKTISGNNLLVSIQECDSKNICKVPTCFEYEQGNLTISSFENIDTGITGLDASDLLHWGMIVADINGDGKDDILYRLRTGTASNGWGLLTWYYRLSNGEGFDSEVECGFPAQLGLLTTTPTGGIRKARAYNPIPADIDGDGMAEVAFPLSYGYIPGKPDFWRYYKLVKISSGEMKFKPLEESSDLPGESDFDLTEQQVCINGNCTDGERGGRLFFADMNGDGLPEILHNISPPLDGDPTKKTTIYVDLLGEIVWSYWGLRRNDKGNLNQSIEVMSDLPSGDPNEHETRAYTYIGDRKLSLLDPTHIIPQHNSYIVKLNGTIKESLIFPSIPSEDRYPEHPPDWNTWDVRYRAAKMSSESGMISIEDTTLLVPDVAIDPPVDQHPEFMTENFYYIFVDLNADGYTDVLKISREGGNTQIIWNTGAGFSEPVDVEIPLFQNHTLGLGPRMQENGLFIIDLDQDGLPEFLMLGVNQQAIYDIGIPTPFPYMYKLMYNRTESKYYFNWSPIPMLIDKTPDPFVYAYDYSSPELTFSHMLDIDGNGIMDLIWLTSNDDSTRSIHLYKNKGKKPDMLTGICEGSGARIGISYSSIIGRSDANSPCEYPSYCVARGLWVVSEYWVDNGDLHDKGVFITSKKEYEVVWTEPRFDKIGRGFLGFSQRVIRDKQYGLEWTTFYDNKTRIDTSYPYAYLPQKEIFTAAMPSGRTFTRTTIPKYKQHTLDGPFERKPFSVLPIDITQTEKENSDTLRDFHTVLDYDDYDNLKHRSIESITDGYTQTWDATYEYSQVDSRWLITQLTEVKEESKIAASGRSQTRTRKYFPNSVTGLIDNFILEPNNRDLYLQVIYDYDSDGNIKNVIYKTWGGTFRKIGFTFENDNTTVKTISRYLDPVTAHTSEFIYHPASSLLAYKMNPDGVYTQWKYDGFGRIREASPSNGPNLEVNYLEEPNKLCGYVLNQKQNDGSIINISYDQLGRPWHLESIAFDGNMSGKIIQYDPFFSDKINLESDSFFGPINGLHASSGAHLEYDLLGRVLRVKDDKNKDLHYEYEYTSLKTTVYSVVGDGDNAIKTKIRYYIKDSFDRIVQSVDIFRDGTVEREISTYYYYGLFGQLEVISDSNFNRINIEYDILGKRKRLADPDTGETKFYYDGFGQLQTKSTAKQELLYSYDNLGRLTKIEQHEQNNQSKILAAFYYDGSLNSSITDIGKLTSSNSSDGIQKTYVYDNNGRLFKIGWNIYGYGSFDIKIEYDMLGRISLLHYPNTNTNTKLGSLVLKYVYNTSGRLEKIVDNDNGIVYWQVDIMDENDFLRQETFGNKNVTTRTYDDTTKLLNQINTVDSAGKIIQNLIYSYYDNGKLLTQKDSLSPVSSDSAKEEKFEYDSLNRLNKWSVLNRWSYQYDYDDLGNLFKKTIDSYVPHPVESVTNFYPEEINTAGPHAITNSSYGNFLYDEIGNQIGGPNRNIEYNLYNLPTLITQLGMSVQLRYDASGSRVVKESEILLGSMNETTIYIENLYEKRIQGDDVKHIFHIFSPSRLVAQIIIEEKDNQVSKNIFYIHDDHLGSTHTITNDSGEVLDIIKFDPFGNIVDRSNPVNPSSSELLTSSIHYGFTGHEHDSEVHLINMKGRIYDPKLHRFLTADPFISQPYFGQSLNRYSYVLNNPSNLVDPSGFEDQPSWPGTASDTPPSAGPDQGDAEKLESGFEQMFYTSVSEGFFNRNWSSDAERKIVKDPPCPNCHNALPAASYYPNIFTPDQPHVNNRQFLAGPPDPSKWSGGGGNGGGGYGGGFPGPDVPDFEGGQEGAAPDPKPRSRILTENERLMVMTLALAPAGVFAGLYLGGAYAAAIAEAGEGALFAKGGTVIVGGTTFGYIINHPELETDLETTLENNVETLETLEDKAIILAKTGAEAFNQLSDDPSVATGLVNQRYLNVALYGGERVKNMVFGTALERVWGNDPITRQLGYYIGGRSPADLYLRLSLTPVDLTTVLQQGAKYGRPIFQLGSFILILQPGRPPLWPGGGF